jgi:hypothetical protein
MNKTFEQLGYKVGDTVRCLYTNPNFPSHEAGEVVTLIQSMDGPMTPKSYLGTLSDWKLVKKKEDKMKTTHNYKVGDKVIWTSNEKGISTRFTVGTEYVIKDIMEAESATYYTFDDNRGYSSGGWLPYRFKLAETKDPVNTAWEDMTPEQKVEILMASHKGEPVELLLNSTGRWETLTSKPELHPTYCYRVKGSNKSVKHVILNGDKYNMTYNLIDGVVDCSSAKLEKD